MTEEVVVTTSAATDVTLVALVQRSPIRRAGLLVGRGWEDQLATVGGSNDDGYSVALLVRVQLEPFGPAGWSQCSQGPGRTTLNRAPSTQSAS